MFFYVLKCISVQSMPHCTNDLFSASICVPHTTSPLTNIHYYLSYMVMYRWLFYVPGPANQAGEGHQGQIPQRDPQGYVQTVVFGMCIEMNVYIYIPWDKRFLLDTKVVASNSVSSKQQKLV